MYNYLINFRPLLLGAPLQLGALSARLVRLWVNPALRRSVTLYADTLMQNPGTCPMSHDTAISMIMNLVECRNGSTVA